MISEQIKTLEEEIRVLEETLYNKKEELRSLKTKDGSCSYTEKLSTNEVVRYSRQMIIPQVTHSGQIKLKNSKVLIVGAGGLGCPASLYLAAAGIGEIHIIDYDEVELSNLHRQILHFEEDIDKPKVNSAYNKLKRINGNIKIIPIYNHASSSIAEFVSKYKYNVVLDCTDNAPTRYFLNDLCVFQDIPLVSGSALQMEGQLTVYHYQNGPCYRCLFPSPPPAHTVTNCGDGGVLGPVAGVIGVLQALETIKIITNNDGVLSGRLLVFDGSEGSFRNVKLRNRMATCDICGNNPKIISLIDYEQFCGSKAHDKVVNVDLLKSNENIDVKELPKILDREDLVIDVRPELEFQMCKLPKTRNVPYLEIVKTDSDEILKKIFKEPLDKAKNVYFLCRRGNDSQRTVEYLRQIINDKSLNFFNIKGGLHAYSRFIDNSFPIY